MINVVRVRSVNGNKCNDSEEGDTQENREQEFDAHDKWRVETINFLLRC